MVLNCTTSEDLIRVIKDEKVAIDLANLRYDGEHRRSEIANHSPGQEGQAANVIPRPS